MNITFSRFKHLYFIFIFSICLADAFAQSISDEFKHDIKRVVSPSPEASSLGKYGQIPVNMQLGLPEISIPLYEIKGQDLSLPISLSYHGGGFQVSEVASSVGLGWTLNGGGVISRFVKGWPDEATQGYYNTMLYYNQNIKGTVCNSTADANSLPCNWRVAAANGEVDLEPDEFSFNFNGYSGRIIFNEDKQPIFYPFQNLKIEGSILTDWIITVPDGTKYYFEKKERSTFRYGGSYTSAWYLTRIQSARSNEYITFTYTDNGHSWLEDISSKPKVTSLSPFYTESGTGNACTSSQLQTETEMTGTTQLSSIGFPKYGLSVSLSYANDRIDIGTQSTLQRLTKLSVSKYAVIQSYTFENNAYFEGKNNANESSYLCRRLKLNALKNDLNNTRYSFEYEPGYQMPSYNSPDVDHWGFYNDANNSSFIPPIPSYYKGHYVENSWLTANKETNANAVKACMLNKITYPTGGYTQFNWESNVVSYENEQKESFKNASVSCANGAISMTGKESNLATYMQNLYVDDVNMPINLHVVPFVKTTPGQVQITLNTNPTGSSSTIGYRQAYIYKFSSDVNANTLRIPLFDIMNDPNCRQILNGQSIDLTTGAYFLIAIVSKNLSSQSIVAYVDYTETEIVKYRDQYVGGVRINEINSYDAINPANNLQKTYSYKRDYPVAPLADEPVGYTRSSGKLFADPYHSNYTHAYVDPCTHMLNVSSFLVDATGEPLRNEGSHIGYGEVTEISKGKAAGVKTIKYLNNYMADQRSLVVNETSFDNTLKPVKLTDNQYTSPYYLQSNYHQMIIRLINANKVCNSDGMYCTTYYNFSDKSSSLYTSGWTGLKETNEKTYNLATGSPIECKTQYFYDGADANKHTFLTRKNSYNSDGTLVLEQTKYPWDFSASGNILQTLIANHIINKPIEQLLFNNSKLVASYYNKYNSSNGLLNVSETYECDFLKQKTQPLGLDAYGNLDPNTYYKKMLSFDYDGSGNIITQTKTNVMSTSYLWGYGNSLPVVQIQNIAQGDIPSAVTANISSHAFSGSTNYNDIQTDIAYLKTQLSTLSSAANYMITLYTYKPLIGITSATDPRGTTTYYNYDAVGRLSEIYRMVNGAKQSVQTYQYNFKP